MFSCLCNNFYNNHEGNNMHLLKCSCLKLNIVNRNVHKLKVFLCYRYVRLIARRANSRKQTVNIYSLW